MANSIKIYKSKQAEELDEAFRGTPEQLRGIYNTALSRYDEYANRPLSAMVSDLAGLPDVPWNGQAATHFAGGWVADEAERERRAAILRNGYREAFQLALNRDSPVPVETFWVTGAGDDFEVHISDGVDHVTVFMVDPSNDYPLGSQRAFAKSWVLAPVGSRTPADGRQALQVVGADDVVKTEVSGSQDSGR